MAESLFEQPLKLLMRCTDSLCWRLDTRLLAQSQLNGFYLSCCFMLGLAKQAEWTTSQRLENAGRVQNDYSVLCIVVIVLAKKLCMRGALAGSSTCLR